MDIIINSIKLFNAFFVMCLLHYFILRLYQFHRLFGSSGVRIINRYTTQRRDNDHLIFANFRQ